LAEVGNIEWLPKHIRDRSISHTEFSDLTNEFHPGGEAFFLLPGLSRQKFLGVFSASEFRFLRIPLSFFKTGWRGF
jgi:hypothetical protein